MTAAGAADWFDLTRPLADGLPVYPGDPAVRIAPALMVAEDGAAVLRLEMGSHTGTHVDAPAHTQAGGRTVDRLTREELCGPALVLGLAGLAPDEPVAAARLAPLLPADVPVRLLLATGWDAHLHDDALRTRHPHLAADAARLLWSRGVRLLGVDALSPDRTGCPEGAVPEGGPAPGFPVHARFLGRDGVIVENLTGLARLRPAGTGADRDWAAVVDLEVHPLPIAGGDGAPARVWARAVRCDA